MNTTEVFKVSSGGQLESNGFSCVAIPVTWVLTSVTLPAQSEGRTGSFLGGIKLRMLLLQGIMEAARGISSTAGEVSEVPTPWAKDHNISCFRDKEDFIPLQA